MELIENAALVFDNGSGMMKAGFAGDEEPTVVFSSVVGKPKRTAGMSANDKKVYVAAEALQLRDKLTLRYPVESGIVVNWEDMEVIWEHAFQLLKVKSSEHAVLVTEPPLNPKVNREKMLEIMFEKFSSPAVYIALQAILSLYGAGRTTGLVLDSGDGVTHTIPIYEGYAFAHCVKRLNLAGRDLSEYFMSLMADKGHHFSTTAEREIAREIKEEIMFEKFSSPAVYIALQAILSLYGAGRTTGLVLDSGDGVTHTIPIYEGYAFAHCVKRLNLAGRDLSEYFMSLMADKGHHFSTTAEREIAREIKEKLCYVSLDFDNEYKTAESDPAKIETSYTLPDGKKITVGKEKFLCPELLFRPSLLGLEESGMHRVVYDTIQDCEIDIRAAMYGNIILSGGSTMFPNLAERLETEIGNLMPNREYLKPIYAPSDRKFSVWIGGSILAPLKAFQENWITREEYEEYGVEIVHQKCIY
eukprot:TRINITY_DN21036_c0_g1_i1.p1 TRINITY_DN21036_c0_g1~~TRINITY_DN21036_c0_g1_i1.p1  ORF type:complete len:472 (-),score=127.32 TRINITY_DN21036_c0_g1_i1:71-1486(-)